MIRIRIKQDWLNGDRWQAQYQEGEMPWTDIGDAKDTWSEADAAAVEFEGRHRTGHGR
jgi:hypothetical protein